MITEKMLIADHRTVSKMLLELGIPIHRIGFWQLCFAIPQYAEDPIQSVTKELYPNVAKHFNCRDWRNIEHSIREAILSAWINRDPVVWNDYFPNYSKSPSNKQFISTLAAHINKIPLPFPGGDESPRRYSDTVSYPDRTC